MHFLPRLKTGNTKKSNVQLDSLDDIFEETFLTKKSKIKEYENFIKQGDIIVVVDQSSIGIMIVDKLNLLNMTVFSNHSIFSYYNNQIVSKKLQLRLMNTTIYKIKAEFKDDVLKDFKQFEEDSDKIDIHNYPLFDAICSAIKIKNQK